VSTTVSSEDREALVRAEWLAREHAAREAKRRKRKRAQLGGVIGAAVVILVALVAISSSTGGSGTAAGGPRLTAVQVEKLLAGIPQHGITLGRDSAPVTVSEFADLQCPFCQAYTMSESPTIVSRYVKTGKVKFVFRNLAVIGPQSTPAAQAAAAAGLQNKLWNFADVFYANQREENSGYVTTAFITRVGSEVPGLAVNQMLSERANPVVAQQLAEAQTLAKAHDVVGTPTFIVQRAGHKPVKVLGASGLQPAIDKALHG
jgi:protein-disulfide isomerase